MRNWEKCMIYIIGEDMLFLTSKELFKILDETQIFYRKMSKKYEVYRKKVLIAFNHV